MSIWDNVTGSEQFYSLHYNIEHEYSLNNYLWRIVQECKNGHSSASWLASFCEQGIKQESENEIKMVWAGQLWMTLIIQTCKFMWCNLFLTQPHLYWPFVCSPCSLLENDHKSLCKFVYSVIVYFHMTLPTPYFVSISSWFLTCHYSVNSGQNCLKLETWSCLYVSSVLLTVEA